MKRDSLFCSICPDEIITLLREKRHCFDTPQVYLGREPNTIKKDWDKTKLKILFVAPYRYEDFRGNQTIPLLYQTLNEWRDDVLCERAFFPNTLREYKFFRAHGLPIFGLESYQSMGVYDIVMTSLSFLPPWINFPLMLKMSGIPPFWRDRDSKRRKPLFMIGGSAIYGNFSVAYPVVDMMYVGDAEDGLFDFLTMWLSVKEHGLTIEEGVQIAQKDFDFIFCPSLYRPVYDKEKFVKWQPKHRLGKGKSVYPTTIKRATCHKLDEVPAYTKPIASYMDSSMGLGEVELSRGCRGTCAFCGIGWKYRPYRERSTEFVVEAMKENKKYGGAWKGLCPIATEFAYYSEKRKLMQELLKVCDIVDPLSMRVDAFIQDPEFDGLLRGMGMNQVAIGVEGCSQRLRNRLMKGITEEDIIEACRIADGKKFRKAKFFMISNIGETQEDWEEFYALLTRIKKDYKIPLVVSHTPLFIEPCTPLQWKKPTIEHKTDWKAVSKRFDELGVRYPRGGGGKHEPNFLWTMQGLHLGDTRFAEAVVLASLELDRPFYAAFSKKMKATISKYLKKTGGSWKYIMRERGVDETFPWDIVDRKVSKLNLLHLYEQIKSGEMDTKQIFISPPKQDMTEFDLREKAQDTNVFARYLVKFEVSDDYAVVPNLHLAAVFHRAANLADVPLATGKLHFFDDRDARNWYHGIDYVVMGMQRLVSDEEFERMNEYLGDDVWLLKAEKVIYKKGMYKKARCEYEVFIDDIDFTQLQKHRQKFFEQEKVEVRCPETRYFSGEYKSKVDLRQICSEQTVIAENLNLSVSRLRVFLEPVVGIRYFLKGFLPGVSFARILRLGVKKVAFYLWDERVQDVEKVF